MHGNQCRRAGALRRKQPDPYVLNSRGNVHASLGKWASARQDYLASQQGFQGAKGFRGAGGSTTMRLDGAVFSASNAALMAVQLGQEDQAVKEVRLWGKLAAANGTPNCCVVSVCVSLCYAL